MKNRYHWFIPSLLLLLVPLASYANIVGAVFITDPQTIAPEVLSDVFTLQTQAAGGISESVTSTACVSLQSDSAQGEFFSNTAASSAVHVVTMSKNTANKNFYYRDSQPGVHTITAQIALKPESESRSCTSWPTDEWQVAWSASQTVTLSSGESAGAPVSDSPTKAETPSSASVSSGTVPSYVPPIVPLIYAYAGTDRDVIAGADVVFIGAAYDRKGDAIGDQNKVRFLWSFGDGGSAEGASVAHHFSQPGRYAVVLDIAQAVSVASDQAIVTAHPVSIDVSIKNGAIVLANTSGRDLDLSGWHLRSGTAHFTLPNHTILLKGAAVPFAFEITRLAAASDAVLLYPNGSVASGIGAASAPSPVAEDERVANALPPALPTVSHNEKENGTSVEMVPDDDATLVGVVERIPEAMPAQTAAVASVPLEYSWWGGAGVLALSAAAALFAARRAKKDEWEIEDASESA